MQRRLALLVLMVTAVPLEGQLLIRAETLHTLTGPPIADGACVIGRDGKIAAVGPASGIAVPPDARAIQCAVAVPGLIDARCTIGVSGFLNQPQDQDQVERSAPLQPELRAVDAYNSGDRLVQWVRELGVTTLHTGHAPGALVSGQTMVVKTAAGPPRVLVPACMVAATLGDGAKGPDGAAPGTRPKAVAMLRGLLLEAQEYARKRAALGEGDEKRPARDLRLETVAAVLARELPLLVTAHREQDLRAALALAQEFGFRLVLDGAAEAPRMLAELAAAGVPVLAHAPMARHTGERENATFELGAKLREAGIRFAYQSGFEDYVPKTRVVLWEAAVGAAHGLGFEAALRAVTLDAAEILGVADRVGSLSVGKDGDLALYDGDPFEYTTHCVGVVIDGVVVSEAKR
jgi:imidazolonepropionase-like amidohydrolase